MKISYQSRILYSECFKTNIKVLLEMQWIYKWGNINVDWIK